MMAMINERTELCNNVCKSGSLAPTKTPYGLVAAATVAAATVVVVVSVGK